MRRTNYTYYEMSQKKKIGVITFWDSQENYGQQLQCWALQQYLRELGHHPFLIRSAVGGQFSKRKFPKQVKKIVKNWLLWAVRNTLLGNIRVVRNYFIRLCGRDIVLREFDMFRQRELDMSKTYGSYEELCNQPPRADVYIAGSDQIWHSNAPSEWFKIALLNFGDKEIKRIAYAPSMPFKNFSEEKIRMLKSYLPSFSSISTRETSSTEYLMSLGFDSNVVLDPTLLLRAEDYYKLYLKEKAEQGIFIYSINYTDESEIPIESIKQYAKTSGLDVIVTPSSGYEPSTEMFSGVRYEYTTIPKWLKCIESARLVVTPSFHGIVFAILLHTPFMFTPLIGKHSRGNERITELLQKLGLLDCIWDGKNTIDKYVNMPIDWSRVETLLDEMREQSQKYLCNAIDK